MNIFSWIHNDKVEKILKGRLVLIPSLSPSVKIQIIGVKVYFLERLGSNGFQLKRRFGTHGNYKNQNPGGRFGATS